MTNTHNKPCAAEGLTSYRYKLPYSWVMVGASSTFDALKEVSRSINGVAHKRNLQIWNGTEYTSELPD